MKEELRYLIEEAYHIEIKKVVLIRDMIGTSYQLITDEFDYLFKLYHEMNSEDAIKSLKIYHYLSTNNAPIPRLYPTNSNSNYIELNHQVGALFEFIDGFEVSVESLEEEILHSKHIIDRLMEKYNESIPLKSIDFYVDRYLDILQDIDYPKDRILELKRIGETLYKEIVKLPIGFCHGDFHLGNMIRKSNQLYIYDFDACGTASKYLDYITLYDQTNFNQFKTSDLLDTKHLLSSKPCIEDKYVKSMICYIAIRHYELIATIIKVKGFSHISDDFFNQQYDWIKAFYKSYIQVI